MKSFVDVQEQRQFLEKRICDVDAELRSLKQAYNAISIPNQLPVETLSYIFAFCAADATQQFKSTDQRSISWIEVIHVCRHWREVALNCTELWSNLLFVNEELANFMLAQSKAAPLSLKVYVNQTWQQAFVRKLTSQLHRWQCIVVEGRVESDMWPDFTTPAPMLQKLVFRPFSFLSISTLPDTSFKQGNAPLLKHLELENLGVSSLKTLPISPILTYLELEEDPERRIRLCGQELLETLQQLPLLETLVLTDCIPNDLGNRPSSTAPIHRVHCPALRSISLAGRIERVQDLLDCLQIHEEAFLTFNLVSAQGSGLVHTLVGFFISLASAWRTSFGVQDLAVDDTPDFDIDRQYRFYTKPSNAPNENPKFKIFFRDLEDEDTLQAPLLTLAKSVVPIADLQVLSMRAEHDFTEGEWRDIFGHLPALREITFDSAYLNTFLKVLNHAPMLASPGNGQGQCDTPSFPSLRKITIKDMPYWDSDVEGDFGMVFMAALKSRPDANRLAFLHAVGYGEVSLWKRWHKPSGMSLWDAVRKNFPDLLMSWQEI